MSSRHHLAGESALWLKDLKEEKFICDSSRMNLSKLQNLCQQQGFEPKVAYEVESSALIFHLLELNAGISFMPIAQVLKIQHSFPDHAAKIHMARIRDDIPKASIGLAYHRSFTFTYAANCLLEHIREFFRREDEALARLEA